MLGVLTWWLALSALGWLTWPLWRLALRRLPGEGYAHARAAGLLGTSYLVWLAGVLGGASNTVGLVRAAGGLLSAAGLALWWAQRRELLATLRRSWRHVLAAEALFALALGLYALYRSHDPAVWHTEQPMDYALLRSLYTDGPLPPSDPWFAGHSVNYYYLGYLAVSVAGRLAGAGPGVAYNLGLAQTLALGVVGAYAVLYDLLSPRRAGGPDATPVAAAGALAVFGAANVAGLRDLLERLGQWGGGRVAANWWWDASRALQDGTLLGRSLEVITEFPAFSFVLGDLHPHVMDLPPLLLVLAVALALHRHGAARGSVRRGLPLLLISPLAVGALGATNSWDLPTGAVLAAGAYALGRREGERAWRPWLGDAVGFAAGLAGGSVLLYLPFYLQFAPRPQEVALLAYTRTPLGQYLGHFGLWAGVLAVAGALRLRRRLPERGRWRVTLLGLGCAWAAILTVPWLLAALVGGWALALLGAVVTLARGPWLLVALGALLALYLHEVLAGERRVSDLLIVAGLGLTYLTEFVYLRDLFGTRMNTVFKLYYQAWMLLGLGAVAAATELYRAGRGWRAAAALWTLLVVAAAGYPLAAGYDVAAGVRRPRGLDATAHLAVEAPDEYGAIRWLEANAPPGSVLAEAWGEAYDPSHNRVSAWSGVPTVLGWVGHERQWRDAEGEIRRRQEDLAAIYTTEDRGEVLAALERYGVAFVVLGPRERTLYGAGPERDARYADVLEEVYAAGDVTLWRVPR